MPDIEIEIGGRRYEVACQVGEEQYLISAANMLDTEAQVLIAQTGRLPEIRMLLMSGLMLADKTAAAEEKIATLEKTVQELQQQGGSATEVDLSQLSALAERAEQIVARHAAPSDG